MTPAQIQQLSTRELVRKRPGMYIGGKDTKALHRLIDDLLQTMIGENTSICMTLLPGESVLIRANSTLPDIANPKGLPPLEAFMTTWTAKNLFTLPPNGNYFMLNALSEQLVAEFGYNGIISRQEYIEGVPTTHVQSVPSHSKKQYIQLLFKPDFTVFEVHSFNYGLLIQRCRELTYLIPRLTITLRDKRSEVIHEDVFHRPNGLTDWIHALNAGKTPLHDILTFDEDFEVTDSYGNPSKIHIAFVLQYVQEADSNLLSYVNTVETTQGGTHITGFLEGLRRALKRHQQQRPTRKPMVLPGLTAVLKLLHPNPMFESMSKIRLTNPEVEQVTRRAVTHAIKQRPDVLAALAQKLEQA
jgi:DNA gyrase subunit B